MPQITISTDRGVVVDTFDASAYDLDNPIAWDCLAIEIKETIKQAHNVEAEEAASPPGPSPEAVDAALAQLKAELESPEMAALLGTEYEDLVDPNDPAYKRRK